MTLTQEQLQQCVHVTEKTLKFALELPSTGLALTGLLSAYATLAFHNHKTGRQECARLLFELAEKLNAHEDGDHAEPAKPMQHHMPPTVQ